MSDDIVTRLRNNFATKDYPMLKDHCHCCAIPKEWGGHHDNCLYDKAADEIERLRELLWKYENCEMVCESPCEPDWDDGECETCDKHRKAVRGE